MAKKKDNKRDKKDRKDQPEARDAAPASGLVASEAATEPKPKMSRKEFEKELEKLEVELVKLAGVGQGQRRQGLRALRGT